MWHYRLLQVLMVALLASCVTTQESPYTSKVNKPRALETQIQIAVSYLQENQPEKAIFHLKQAVEDNPESARVHEILALALEKAGEQDLALSHFRKMVQFEPAYSRGRANFGSYLIRQGNCKEAIKHLKIVTEDIYYPNRATTYYQIGKCQHQLGNFEEVGAMYQKAVKLDGNFALAYLEIAQHEFNNKQYAKSLEYLKIYRTKVEKASAGALLLSIRLARIFEDIDGEASYTLALKNLYPDSAEYLEYLNTLRGKK